MVSRLTAPRVTLLIHSVTPSAIAASRSMIARAGLDGVAVAIPLHHVLPGPRLPSGNITVDSLWLPTAPGRVLESLRQRRLVESATTFTTPRLVVPWPVATGRGASRHATAGLIAALSRQVTTGRITLAVRPDHRHPIRDQLLAMTALRRLAEEWDYDLALDLSGTRNGPWEAEAALHRMMPRLTTIRLGRVTGNGWGRSTDPRMASRVLSAARDVAFAGTIVIEPAGWPLSLGPDKTHAAAAMAAMVRDRFAGDRGVWPPSRSSEPSRWVV